MEDSQPLAPDLDLYLDCGFATRALHAGQHAGQPQHASHVGAIYQSSTFVFQDATEGARIFSGDAPGYIYTRLGNPDMAMLEAKMNALEGREVKLRHPDLRVSSLAFASGMAAISTTLMALAGSGDTIILGERLYATTQHLADHVLARMGVHTVYVDTTDLAAVERGMRAHPRAKAFFFETPTNPTLDITDIEATCRLVRSISSDTCIVVDNTFATPCLQRPLELGADVVLHSTTKYLCGHGTVVGGVMTTIRDEVRERAYTVLKDVGGSPGPFDAWLVTLGIKTLPLRMERHCHNAMAIARFLEQHPQVERVYYPGLEGHPGHALARKQMSGFGGMLSFELRGGLAAGRQLMDTIRIFTLAVSLGCVDSLIQHPASMSHSCVPREVRERAGVTDGLVRVSVGLEDTEDLIGALDAALARLP